MNIKHDTYINGPAHLVSLVSQAIGVIDSRCLLVVVLKDDVLTSIFRSEIDSTGALEGNTFKESRSGLDSTAVMRELTDADLVLLEYCDSFNTTIVDSARAISTLVGHGVADQFNILDQLIVVGNRWRSVLCTDVVCCPTSGRLVEQENSEFLRYGSASINALDISREQYESFLSSAAISVDEVALRDREMISALDDIKSGTVETESIENAKANGDFRIKYVGKLIERLLISDPMNWKDTARLVAGLHDIHIRDCLLKRFLSDSVLREAAAHHLLVTIPRASESSVVVLATALAGIVWLDGHEALAKSALDRALECDPSYSLAVLLNRAISFGVPSSVWSDSLEAVTEEECLQGAA